MGGKVPAPINDQFPEKYLKKNATVTVIPELRYANGLTAQGTAATFQGEKVMGNNQTISYRLGRSEEHTSELQSRQYLVCRLLLEKKKYRRHLHWQPTVLEH